MATKLPLQSSTAHNAASAAAAAPGGKKTIEQVYQKKSQLEHILLRPDTYIGSVEKHTQSLWVFEGGEMVYRAIAYVPGLYKIFDEILVNAADNKQRDPSMDCVKVEIDAEQNLISVYNNGDGVPVEIHQEEGVYVPELIFGHLLTSSNYDDNVKKTTGGRNGYGAKLTNIFSTEFVIQTADGKRQKKYKQVFLQNMGKKSEPSITKCKEGENWTKVSFKPDLAKFNMTHLEDDVVALMKKRVVDLAGTLGKGVKVELNGARVPVKTFTDYVDLYLKSANKTREVPLPRIMEKASNNRWEVCVSLSEGQFQQVSFVNGINTIKGGTHVEYVTNQIANHVMAVVNKKNKNANIKAHNVKNYLWVFVNALIDNPAFDSQTKETLTTRQGSFGSKCEFSQDFLKKVDKSGIVGTLLSWADFKQNKELKKTDGAKKQNISGIPKLDDANEAGGKNSEKCTLILTEGDSAKALAVAGVSEVGRDHYGVFPLRGKLLNVREATVDQIKKNAEIQNIKQILGLQHGKEYDSVKGLRYGHLMIMTDQDHDGSHIKGLLINFIHSFWPSLLKIKGFMVEFITPIVKASHKNGTKLSFYTMPEYEAWKESVSGNASGWTIKYYKGLGTSTSAEGKEYFREINRHKKSFVWADEHDGEAIELAFSKKKIDARKNWLRQFVHGTYLDHKEKEIKYSDFVNKELILFSRADLQRSIPSVVDGLKPGQRKILFCAFKRNFVKEAKVAQFSGYVSEHSAYHHGEQSLASTIIGMAQDFVGSNNINLLQPNGQFGTRNKGGKDAASARYVYTCLSPITRFLFPKDDDLLLDYLNEDGQSIEPAWYMPIIPVVLVNGSEGIGTGWSSYVPNYNPRDVIANVRRLLNDEPMLPMDPWYRGFKGTIEKSAEKETGLTYTISGIIEEVDSMTLRITELPIRSWTEDYGRFLDEMVNGTDKFKEPFIQEKRAYNDDITVHFEVILSEENMNAAKLEGLEKKFKLTTTISTSNMHLFDSNGIIKKYDTPEQILEDFFHLRLQFYEKRKKILVDNLELDLLRLDNKVRFILGVVHGEIIVNNRKRAELFLELHQKGFTPFPKKTKGVDAAIAGATIEAEENEEDSPEMVKGAVKASDYEYLLSMSIGTLTMEKVQQLCAEKDKQEQELDVLRNTSPRTLWMRDLDALEKQLDEQDMKDATLDKRRQEMRSKIKAGAAVSKRGAPRKPRKNNAIKKEEDGLAASATDAATGSTSTATDAGNVAELGKPKPRGGRKKAVAKKTTEVESDDEDELHELKDRLAAYKLDSSPDQTSVETDVREVARKKEPSKRAAARKAKSTLIISDDDDMDGEQMQTITEDSDDEDFQMMEEVPPKGKKAGGRRRPTNARVAKATTTTTTNTRKRGGIQGKKTVLSQKLITDVLKPVENASPEKKVRKMRESPFNKKSGSVLGRVGGLVTEGEGSAGSSSSGDLEAEMNAVSVARNRPKREKRANVLYVESGSEEEEEEEEPGTDDSDFEEEEDDD